MVLRPGRQFDAKVKLKKEWWLSDDSVKFDKRAQMLINQFGYSIYGLHVNLVRATQGEKNIAGFGRYCLLAHAFRKNRSNNIRGRENQ